MESWNKTFSRNQKTWLQNDNQNWSVVVVKKKGWHNEHDKGNAENDIQKILKLMEVERRSVGDHRCMVVSHEAGHQSENASQEVQ